MKKLYCPKFLVLIVLALIILLVPLNLNIPSVKAQAIEGVYIYTSCGGTMSANGVSLSGGTTYNYTNGAAVTFTATALSGSKFLYWEYSSSSGTSTSTKNPLVYTIPSSESAVQAMFIPTVNSTLTSSSSQTGTAPFEVPISIGGTTTPAAAIYTNYTIGTVVTFVANANSGFKFLYWLIPAATQNQVSIVTSNTLAFKVTANACAIQAFFEPTSSNITLPTITTVNEFSSVTTIIITAILIMVAFGTYISARKAKK
ncbi:MAG TPA: hypothetical protein VLV84_02910 [Candidatus Acidoferrales bacterium]|nr:hypothetical protein [Candidatus Acidoferrales bacterium]